ncbi:VOC family protein [Clostridia bacterium]|nr:VOC family protein [Clostridia bacterium]
MSKLTQGHVGIFVDDLSVSAKFYQEVLGGSLQEKLVLAKDLIIQHVLFGDFDIELVKQAGMVPTCDGPVNHLCFHANDAKAEYDRIVSGGYEIDEELEDNDDVAYFFFRGPNKERIEIMQRKRN